MPSNVHPGNRTAQKFEEVITIKISTGASRVAQWESIRLPVQETRVEIPVWEDPTSRRGIKPMLHNY